MKMPLSADVGESSSLYRTRFNGGSVFSSFGCLTLNFRQDFFLAKNHTTHKKNSRIK